MMKVGVASFSDGWWRDEQHLQEASMVGNDLTDFSLDAVQMFYNNGRKSEFHPLNYYFFDNVGAWRVDRFSVRKSMNRALVESLTQNLICRRLLGQFTAENGPLTSVT
jgi:hypothetical protein